MGQIDASPIEHLHELAHRRFIPLYVSFEITQRCNLKCVHCYNFDRQSSKPDVKGELTPDEVYRILDELAQEGALMLSFTGGEVLSHPFLLNYVKHARKCRFGIRIKSNAAMLTPKKADELARAGVTGMDVSLYGARAETHDAFTTVFGSFEKTAKGVQAAKSAGMHPNLSIIIHKKNIHELDEIIDFAEDLDVPYFLSTELTARYDGSKSSLDFRLDREGLERFYSSPKISIADLKSESGGVQCSCARTVCGISARGDVYPCIGAPIFCGNLREKAFHEIWHDSEPMKKIRGLTLEDFSSCKACAHRNYCQRSSGAIYTNTGNYTGAEPWTCTEAQVIQERF